MKETIYIFLAIFSVFSTKAFPSGSYEKERDNSQMESELTQKYQFFSEQNYTLEQLKVIDELMSSRKTREIPIQKSLGDNGVGDVDFGYTFPHISGLDIMCLLLINTSPIKSPICYDLGAGFGEQSCNMVLAGGDVTSIEHYDVINTAYKEVYNDLKTVSLNNTQKKELWGRLRMIKANFLNIKNTKIYPENVQINFCNLSNVIHFLTPKQIDKFLPALFEKMAPEGHVFVSVHVPSAPKIVDYFLEQKEKGNPYPGYCRYTRHYKKDKTKKYQDGTPFLLLKNLSDAKEAIKGDQPGKMISRNVQGEKMAVTTVIHLFDPSVIRRAFKRAGFTILQVSLTNSKGVLLKEQEVTRDLLISEYHHLNLIAYK